MSNENEEDRTPQSTVEERTLVATIEFTGASVRALAIKIARFVNQTQTTLTLHAEPGRSFPVSSPLPYEYVEEILRGT